MSDKLTTLKQLKLALEATKNYITAAIEKVQSNFTITDKTTKKVYTLEMDNGLIYFDDGEGDG